MIVFLGGQVLAIFSTMEPAGLLLGWTLVAVFEGQTGRAISGVLTTVAAGMFIYIAIVDILLQEFGSIVGNMDRYLGVLFVCTPFPHPPKKKSRIFPHTNFQAGIGYGTTMFFVFVLGH